MAYELDYLSFLTEIFKAFETTMRDKSVETLSFQRVVWCMLFNYYRLAQKTTPLPLFNVGFPIAQTMGFAAVQR